MHLNQKLGNIFEIEKKHFWKQTCNRCNMSWYRDFSIYFQGIKSLPVFIELLPIIKIIEKKKLKTTNR